jgi:hypothetical protein
MSNCLTVSVVLASVAFSTVAFADTPQGPSKEVPELQVLNHWLGNWDVDMTVKPNADAPKGMRAKGEFAAEWVLNGRFVQQTGTLTPSDGAPAMKVTTLMTYDPRKKVYRSWMFFSTGFVSESEGQWEEKSRTMTSTSRDADSGRATTIKAIFAEDGTESWSIIEMDREGKVVNETTGKNMRRKK